MTKNINILIVEDSPGDILLMKLRLKDIGHVCCVHVCKDGEEAIKYLEHAVHNFENEKPDLIILDYNLPRRSGGEVLTYMRKIEAYKYTPVIIFSSSSSPKDISFSYEHGANCYVEKPTALDDYYKAIDSIFTYWMGIAALPENVE